MSGEGYIYPRGFASKFNVWIVPVQLIPSGIVTTVLLNTAFFDVLNEFDLVVAFGFTPQQAGYYYIHGQVRVPILAAGTYQAALIYLNGAFYAVDEKIHDGVSTMTCHVSRLFYLTPADIIDLRVIQNSGAGVNFGGNPQDLFFEGFRVA